MMNKIYKFEKFNAELLGYEVSPGEIVNRYRIIDENIEQIEDYGHYTYHCPINGWVRISRRDFRITF